MDIKGCIQMNKRMKPLALLFLAFVSINSSLFSLARSEPLVPGEDSIDLLFKPNHSSSSDVKNSSEKLILELNAIRSRVNQNSRELSLALCLKEGIQNNHQLASAYATIQQYEYSLIATKRGFFPSISLSSLPPFLGRVYTSNSSTRQVSEPVSVNPNGTYSYSTVTESANSQEEYMQFAPYLTFTWSFFQPSLPASISSAKASLNQQRLAFNVSARSAILDLQQSYFKLQSSASLIDSFEKIYLINLEQVKYVEARQKAGLIDIGAVDQAKSQLYSQASELIGYYRDYLKNSSDLALAMNTPGDVIIVPSDDFILVGKWDESISETIDHALAMREEIKEFLESANSSIWSARAAIRSYLPELMLQGYAYGEYEKGSDDGLSFSSQYGFGAIGLGITWDIFDGGVKAAEASSYRSSAKSDQQKAEYTKDKIKQQIRQAYSIYKTSAFALHNAHLNLSASTNSIKVNKSRFSVGLGDITSIVQSMQLLGEATRQYNQAILDHNTSVAELYRYSATWPAQTESIVLQTADKLKKDD